MTTSSELNWEKIAATKRAALAEQIPLEYRIPQQLLPSDDQLDVTTFPKESGWFDQKELEITESSATQILKKIASNSWTSEEVTRAFLKRAAAAQQLTNCLTDFFPTEAISIAKSLDELFQKTGKLVGPLHGLPVSLKDNFNIVGKDSTIGFASLVDEPAAYNATLVELLEKLGAVRYCKTNVPTAMMIPESVNNGGSLRIPAACTGIFTLRPSFGRFTTQDCRSGLAGQEAVMSVNGPMAKSLEDITFYSKAVVDAQPWLIDPKCLPIPWRPAERKSKLKIAVLWNDGIVQPTPPVTRALKETVEKLQVAGHEIVGAWDPLQHLKAIELLGRMFVADGGKSVRKLLAPTDEPWRPEMRNYSEAPELGTYDMWQLHLQRSEVQKQYLEQWMSYDGLDAILGNYYLKQDAIDRLTAAYSTDMSLCSRRAW
ncbi:uncharacterized protein N0V89_002667 [Didymosphaeria variabile]|uniref:Amidase domain-containing protein n=1 Tax=Didymosphaeria variabile TaxID=1932322 RepID=A0A9W9CEU7_9PLEO|nr:uncharacterized protein N0V89_002667 [Didymosphaeria variabile]KAJ4358088.1 hypothetical protein N0V89_002667 [Didymosphaeria variabile]